MKTLFPVLFLSAVLVLVALACSAAGGGTAAPVTPQARLQPTAVRTPTVEQTIAAATSTPKAPPFFREEFGPDYPENRWQRFTLGKGSTSRLVVRQEADHLFVDLGNQDVYAYFMYTPYTYKNVTVRLRAENRGRNNNNVSLVCRMNREGTHWYEFSVSNSGLWTLYARDELYHPLGSGGTNLVKPGQEINEYQMACNGNEIRLAINGQQVGAIRDNKYGFEEGFAGFNVASILDYSIMPITVAVHSFEITPP